MTDAEPRDRPRKKKVSRKHGVGRSPHHVDEHTWYYRERGTGFTLVRQELGVDDRWVRTVQFQLYIRGGRIIFKGIR